MASATIFVNFRMLDGEFISIEIDPLLTPQQIASRVRNVLRNLYPSDGQNFIFVRKNVPADEVFDFQQHSLEPDEFINVLARKYGDTKTISFDEYMKGNVRNIHQLVEKNIQQLIETHGTGNLLIDLLGKAHPILTLAQVQSSPESVKILLENGADPNLKGSFGSALETFDELFGSSNEHEEMRELIKSYLFARPRKTSRKSKSSPPRKSKSRKSKSSPRKTSRKSKSSPRKTSRKSKTKSSRK